MTGSSAGQLTRGGLAAAGVPATAQPSAGPGAEPGAPDQVHPAGPGADPPGGSGRWSPALSPRGDRIAFVSDDGGQPAVWLRDLTGEVAGAGAGAVPLPTGPHPVLRVSWSPEGSWLAVVVAPGGAPRNEIWLVRPDGSGLYQAAGFGDSTACLGNWLPDTALLAVTETGDGDSRAVLLDPERGSRSVLAGGELVTVLDVSRDGSRVLLRRGPRGRRELDVVELPGGRRRPLWPGAGEGCTELACFSADAETVYARTDVGREFAALVALPGDALPGDALPGDALPGDALPGAPAVLAERPDAELEHFALSADGGTLALLWNTDGGRSALTVLDLRSGESRPLPLPGAVVADCAFSRDGRTLVLTAEGPDRPRDVWTVAVDSGAATPAGAALPAGATTAAGDPALASTDTLRGTAPELRRLRSADGLEITGWLYLPADRRRDRAGDRAGDRTGSAGPWPTVIHLHGGPEAQERPGYSPLFRALTAQGIAVFAPNVRGSSGFGRSFGGADNLAGRYGAIADVAACVAHLVETGVAAPGRVGCMGRSYGGYLTLAALVSFPELFAVGVDICGMADFATFYERTEPWIAAAAVSKYGHPESDRELLRDLSPLHRMERLAAPLLVVHGAHDSNVPVYEAEQVVAAARERGLPHRYLLFDGEGHELLDPANRGVFIRETVAWLETYLGDPAQAARAS
jgi:dipeptidyl aminopeptidase/acylaminoacyl peptidase